MKFVVALAGLLFPGLGHAMLGRRGRAAVFFVVLSSMFYAGVFLEREFYYKFGPGLLVAPPQDTIPIRDHRPDELEGAVDKVWKVIFVYGYPFFVGFGNYYVGTKWVAATSGMMKHVPGVLNPAEIPVTTRDIGYCFALLAGLLNLLVMMDAFDIACNQEELARRGLDRDKKEGPAA